LHLVSLKLLSGEEEQRLSRQGLFKTKELPQARQENRRFPGRLFRLFRDFLPSQLMSGNGTADVPTVDAKVNTDSGIEEARWLIQRVLGLLSGMAAAGSSSRAADFRKELAVLTKAIVNPLPGESVDTASRKCVALCQDFFQKADSFRVNNEATYGEIIDLLRDAVRVLAGDASLDGLITTSTTRFREIVETRDVDQLKRLMTEEIHALERSVRECRARREQTVSKLTERAQSLEQRLTRTRERLSLTLAESSLDSLTRVANRRYFDLQLATWMEPRAREHPFVLAMFDIDDFKKINDAHGHQVGDRVLRGIARTLRAVTRDEDVLARYGGEEFILLLRNVTVGAAMERCTEILHSVAAQVFDWEDAKRNLRVRTTVSCGITEFVHGDSVYDLLRRADMALYSAKKLGKNRIEVQHHRTAADSGVSCPRV
jgi:diguanylate cyclase (GGDEF)-like protein